MKLVIVILALTFIAYGCNKIEVPSFTDPAIIKNIPGEWRISYIDTTAYFNDMRRLVVVNNSEKKYSAWVNFLTIAGRDISPQTRVRLVEFHYLDSCGKVSCLRTIEFVGDDNKIQP